MYTRLQIVNLGLSKIGASRISVLDPPRTSLEVFCAAGYPHWKRSELFKRRWVFSIVRDYQLTKADTLTNVDKPYKYELPAGCLRPIRGKYTEWEQNGTFLYSAVDDLTLSYIKDADEVEFDPGFAEVLACRVALESCEPVTQSNTKRDDAFTLYKDAVNEAGRSNAYIIGPEDVTSDDNDFEFITGRR